MLFMAKATNTYIAFLIEKRAQPRLHPPFYRSLPLKGVVVSEDRAASGTFCTRSARKSDSASSGWGYPPPSLIWLLLLPTLRSPWTRDLVLSTHWIGKYPEMAVEIWRWGKLRGIMIGFSMEGEIRGQGRVQVAGGRGAVGFGGR